jgi:ABC-type glycerol-3-phosphate transport system substrate-binding protein
MDDRDERRLSRREMLRRVALGAAVTGAGGVLAACGSAPAASQPAGTAAGAASGATAAGGTTAAPAETTGAAAAAGGKVKLEYWTGWSGYEFDALKKLVEEFNKQSKLGTVNMTTVFGQYEKVLTAISAGNPPDVVSAVWMSQLPAMAARNALMPLDNYVAQAGIKGEDFFPQLYKSWFYQGKQYGVAVTISSTMLVFNKKVWQEAGLDPNVTPKNLLEFDTMNQKLFTVKDNGDLTRVGYVPSADDFYLWGNVFGGRFYDEGAKKITANDPKIVKALDWVAGYAKKYNITKLDAFAQGYGDYLSANNPLFNGKQGITTAGEWINGIVKQYSPDTQLGFFAPPPPDGGKQMVTTYGGSIFTIPRGAKNPDASWEFIDWLQRPENMERFDATINNLPTRKASAAKPQFSDPAGYKLSQDLLNSPNAQGPLPLPVFDQYLTELGKAVDEARRGTKSSEQALNDLTTRMQTELEKSGI